MLRHFVTFEHHFLFRFTRLTAVWLLYDIIRQQSSLRHTPLWHPRWLRLISPSLSIHIHAFDSCLTSVWHHPSPAITRTHHSLSSQIITRHFTITFYSASCIWQLFDTCMTSSVTIHHSHTPLFEIPDHYASFHHHFLFSFICLTAVWHMYDIIRHQLSLAYTSHCHPGSLHTISPSLSIQVHTFDSGLTRVPSHPSRTIVIRTQCPLQALKGKIWSQGPKINRMFF